MEPNEKKLEAFIDRLMADDTLDKPSVDFTNAIVEKLEVKSRITAYKPLISKKVWGVVIISLIALLIYVFLNQGESDSRVSELLNLSQIKLNPLNDLNFTFPKKLMYAMVVLAVMIGLQVTFLKSYVNKRIQF
ncbi:MAG: hypothetical protein ED556_10135 [Winogradskyella sp.]|uniref:hypothetical protein n=1 Tax=Winogradskyella sp. TaxID=1883156 RepID=UPI000F40C0EB|nr:hypothetical protein [Winogradskyella sp.]RNC84931.1 MAG: hypothetical protein ED556_10135 [Winogradskyella sp.]